MNSKPSKKECELLERIRANVWVYVTKHSDIGRMFATTGNDTQVKGKPELQALTRLRERGLVSQYGMRLTDAGYAFLGTSEQALCIARLQADLDCEIAYAAKMRIEDTVYTHVDQHRLWFYRELYKDATFTVEQVMSACRERIFSNRQNHEERIQALEQAISAAEHTH